MTPLKPEIITKSVESIIEEEEQYLSCPPFNPDQEIKSTSAVAVVMTDDVASINHSLLCVGAAWGLARSIDDVCKLSITTTKLLTERRRLMLMTLEPDDDRNQRRGRGPVAPLSALSYDQESDPRRTH